MCRRFVALFVLIFAAELGLTFSQPAGSWIAEIIFDDTQTYSNIRSLNLYRQGRAGCRFDPDNPSGTRQYMFTQCNATHKDIWSAGNAVCASNYYTVCTFENESLRALENIGLAESDTTETLLCI
jgi:hypothetical protein